MTDERVAQRFRLALDMYEFGERMARSGLRRRHPGATEEQIAQMLRQWRRGREHQGVTQPGGRLADSG